MKLHTGEISIDCLSGAKPSWRASEEPIYLQMIADFGPPGMGAGGSLVVVDSE